MLDEDAVEELVAQMRQPAQRRADLRAQLAANRTGVERLRELRERPAPTARRGAMSETIDYAERRMRACLAALPDGTHEAPRRAGGAPRATSSSRCGRRSRATS